MDADAAAPPEYAPPLVPFPLPLPLAPCPLPLPLTPLSSLSLSLLTRPAEAALARYKRSLASTFPRSRIRPD